MPRGVTRFRCLGHCLELSLKDVLKDTLSCCMSTFSIKKSSKKRCTSDEVVASMRLCLEPIEDARQGRQETTTYRHPPIMPT